MKTTSTLLTLVLLVVTMEAFSQNRKNHCYMDGRNLPAGIGAPTLIGTETASLLGRRNLTWGLIETGNGDTTLKAGYIYRVPLGDTLMSLLSDTMALHNDGLSLYHIDSTVFALSDEDYFMESDGILRNRRGIRLEVMALEFELLPCDKSTEIKFDSDSVAVIAGERQKKILETNDVLWSTTWGSYLPTIPSVVINTIDTCRTSVYSLSVVTAKGATCQLFPLGLAEREHNMVKVQVYEPALIHARHFRPGENGYIMGEEDEIRGFVVTRLESPSTRGLKKLKHAKRASKKAVKQKPRKNNF